MSWVGLGSGPLPSVGADELESGGLSVAAVRGRPRSFRGGRLGVEQETSHRGQPLLAGELFHHEANDVGETTGLHAVLVLDLLDVIVAHGREGVAGDPLAIERLHLVAEPGHRAAGIAAGKRHVRSRRDGGRSLVQGQRLRLELLALETTEGNVRETESRDGDVHGDTPFGQGQ